MSHLFVFHYHLLPGGVTSVIRDGIKAAGSCLKSLSGITLIAGREENFSHVITEIEKYFKLSNTNLHVNFTLIEEMDYIYPGIRTGRDFIIPEFAEKARDLAEKLISKFGIRSRGLSPVWWIHNYHLGKNPVFTEALLIIAQKYPEQRIILQIHDFPESGRFENLKFLKANITHPLYPVSESIRYAVINKRDLKILTLSGIPAQNVFLLENPVEIFKGKATPKEKQTIRNKIFRRYGHRDSLNISTEKIALYPVRTIRRKNVLEAASLICLVNRETQLFVTLPGVSKHEKAYSNTVKTLYSQGYIPGTWGIGTELDSIGISFNDMMSAGDIILSSSVQEGFGFLFIQAIMWGMPLFARRIEVLTGIEELFRDHPHFFYDKFLCLQEKKDRKLLLEEYDKKLMRINHLLPDISIEKAEAELKMELQTEAVDFSLLNVPLQIETLKKLKTEEYSDKIKKVNREILDQIEHLTFATNKIDPDIYMTNIERIEERFGYSAYSKTFMDIISSFDSSKISKKDYKGIKLEQIEAGVIDKFLKKDYLRLIYE